MSVVSLGRFQLRDEDGIGPCWCPPAGVTALIDLVPPGQDADPDVNFALMLSDSPLDSNDCIYSLGTGNVTETQLDGAGQDAWQSVTGFRPTQGTIANAIAQHLLNPNGANGQDFARPLTAGFNRGLEIHLGGEVWSNTLTGLSDPLSLPVLRVEAEGLSEIYRTQGETQYRLAMGALRRKYNTRPVKELIQYLYPSGRDDLPLVDDLTPQTIKTENWNSGTFPNMNQSWTSISGTWSSPSSGLCRAASVSSSRLLLNYSFGGSDFNATFVIKTLTGPAIVARSDATATTYYLSLALASTGQRNVYKSVSGTQTLLNSASQTWMLNDIAGNNPVGSTIILSRNGTAVTTITDTAVTTGTYIALYNSGNGQSDFGQVIGDDLISASGGWFWNRIALHGIRGVRIG